jgi:GT2 family glycosyltransferase/glycosyltransferase involved in cell wall biosynthesis
VAVVKVLLVVHAYPPEGLGGAETYTEALARELARTHEVAVLHRSADPARPDYDVRESSRDGVRVFSLNNLHREAPGFEAYRDEGVTRAAARVMDALRPDVVHVGHLAGLSTGLVFEARRLGFPVVLTLHDFFAACPLGQLLNVRLEVCPGPTPRRCLDCVGAQVAAAPAAARALGRRLPGAGLLGGALSRLGRSGEARIASRLDEMAEVVRAADVRISPSRFLRDRMAALGFADIEVVENGHAPIGAYPRRSDPQGRVRIGFVGSAIPSKGVHVLAEAFRRLAEPRATLEIHGPFLPYHGDTGYEARVRGILGDDAAAILRGAFAHERVGEILAGLDVLVVPSIWEENAPLTIQEAFLAGVPVVVSDHGGAAEAVRDGVGGLRFKPGDAFDLARVLRRFVEEPGLRERLSEARPHVTTMDEHVRALESAYETARRRFHQRPGRVGVVVLDCARPDDTIAAVRSALDATVAPLILVVENGPAPEPRLPDGVRFLRLPENRGYAAGMNAGILALQASGCERILLLNNDAELQPGALRRLMEALDDESLAAVGPTVRRAVDGRVESQGADFDLRRGRYRLRASGAAAGTAQALRSVDVLSGAAWTVRVAAFTRVGPLDEDYFHSFEDADWSVRARAAGYGLAVVTGAVVCHRGAQTLGPRSPDRLYYAARNHLRAVERLLPLTGAARWRRRAAIVARNLAHALRQGEVPRLPAVAAVLAGVRDFRQGRFGKRE